MPQRQLLGGGRSARGSNRTRDFQTFLLCSAFELLHRALHQLLGVVQLLENQRDVHLRFSRKPFATAVHAVLTHERERIGEQIERDRQPAARACPSSSRVARASRGVCRKQTFQLSAISYQLSASAVSFSRTLRADSRELKLRSLPGPRGPQFDAARKAAWIVTEQVDHDFGDVFGRELPVCAFRFIPARESRLRRNPASRS